MARKQHCQTKLRRPRGFRPTLEALELRLIPATVHWNVDADGFWDAPGNWDTGKVPSAGDDVVIDRPGGNFTVTVRDHQTINTLQNQESLDIEVGGGLRIQSAGQLDASVILNGDYLEVDSATNLTGSLTWKAGTVVTGGQGLTNAGVIALNNVSDVNLSGVLFNNATLSESGTGNLGINNTITNNATGLIDFQSDAGIIGSGVITNSGTIRKSAGAGLSRIGPADNANVYFNQLGGTLDAQSGVLRLDQTRTSILETGGTWNAETGALIDFVGNGQSGTYFAGTFTGSGAGTVQLSSGFFGIDSGGATFNFPAGLLQWTGGSFFSNPLTNAGSMTLAGAGDKAASNTINNTGTVIVTGTGNLVVSGTLNNNAGGVVDFRSDGGAAGNGVINNSGTIRKSAGVGVSRIGPSPNVDLYLNQLGGILDAQSGTLLLDQLRTSLLETGGTWNAAAGAMLEFNGATFYTYFAGVFTGSGPGTVQLNSGLFAIDSGGATFNFPAGLLHWVGGTIFGNPLTNSGSITVSGSADKTIGGTFNNGGTIVETDAGNLVVSGTLNNNAAGLIDFQSDAGIAGNGIINHTGMIRKSAGVGVSRIGPSPNVDLYLNQLGGTLDAESGTLRLDQLRTQDVETGGVWNAAAGATLDIVGNGPSGTYFAGNFTGSGAGTVQLSSGSLGIGTGGATFNFPAGLLQWTGGTFFSNPLTNTGSITLAGAADKVFQNTINNTGTIVVTGTGNLLVSGTLNNNSPGMIDFQSDAGFTGTGVVNNSGLIRKSAGAGVSTLTPDLNTNNGAMVAQSGRLNLAGFGFWQGATLNADANAVLEFSGQPALTGAFTGSGAGRVDMSGGFTPVDGGVAGATVTLNFPAGFLHWTGGEIGGGGSASGIGSAIFFTNVGFMTIDGPNTKSVRRNTIVNTGTIVDSGPGDLLLHGIGDFATSTIDNRAGATFELVGGVLIDELPGNKGIFINAGTLRRAGADGTAEIDGAFNSTPTGSIVLDNGQLKLGDGGTFTGGSFNLASGTVLVFALAPGFFIWTGNYTGAGLGTIDFQGGLSGGDDSTPAILNFAPGYFHMSGTWGGTIENDGTITLAGNFARAHIINVGTMIMPGPDDFALNANTYFENRGLFDIQSDASLVVPGDASGGNMRFLNTGTLRKSAGNGTSQLRHDGGGKAFQLNNQGVVEADSGTLAIVDPIVQLSGTTLSAGTWIVRNGATLAFPSGSSITANQAAVTVDGAASNFSALGGLASNSGTVSLLNGGNLTTAAGLTNNGALVVGAGSTLSVHGDLTESSSATLRIIIGGHTGSGLFGQAVVTGQANLAGALAIQLADGFGPIQGDSYNVVTYASKQGHFATISGLDPFFTSTAGAVSVQITALGPAANIAVDSIALPPGGSIGQNVTVSFVVKNTTDVQIDGSWIDSLYLSRDTTFGPDDVLFARVTQSGGLAPQGSYTGTASAALPALIDGAYHVVVIADSSAQVRDTDRTDNRRISPDTLHIEVPAIALGQPANGTISQGQTQLYRIDVPAGSGDLVLSADFGALREAQLFVRYNALPDDAGSFAGVVNATSLQSQVTIPNPQAGAYYVLLQGLEAAAAPQSFTLTPRLATFEVRSLTPNHGSNTGQATFTITGSGFTANSTVSLVSGGAVRAAKSVYFKDSTTLSATFDLTGLNAGSFDVKVVDRAHSQTKSASFTVVAGKPGAVDFTLTVPSLIRPGQVGTLVLNYTNTGDTDAPAPVFDVSAENAVFRLPEQPTFVGESIEVLGISTQGPAGVLPPGYHGQISILFMPETAGAHIVSNFTAAIEDPNVAMDWSQSQEALRPFTEPTDAWNAVYANFMATVGATSGQYFDNLRADATYLSQTGIYTSNIARLLSFQLKLADDFGSITKRYTNGAFGRGQTDSVTMSAATDANGNVTIFLDGVYRPFIRNANGSYSGVPGDQGVLTARAGGGYSLREGLGRVTVFAANGHVDFILNPSGFKTTANYTGNLLTSLVDSTGDTTTYLYNAQGHVIKMTDPLGRVTTYTYDATGNLLTGITGPRGTTTISYLANQTAATKYAIASISYPDGTQVNFQYDAQGHTTQKSNAGGAIPITYAYGPGGAVSITDAAGSVSRVLRDDSESSSVVTDPLNQVVSASFDSNEQLTGLAGSGAQATEGRNSAGRPTTLTDAAGNTTTIAYGPDLNRATKVTDSNGNSTSFVFNAQGMVLSVTNAAGQSTQFSYDAAGNRTQTTLVSGIGQTTTYDAHGLVLSRTFTDGASIQYGYDGHRNLISIADPSGVTTMTYDAGDRMTSVTYPSGLSIHYSYDAFGRRTQVATQDGFAVNYQYDSLSRLARVSDAADHTLATFAYDVVGRLASKTLANGASTSYSYDAAGNLISLINRGPAPGNAIQSEFIYTYDVFGRVSTMTTLDGTTSYGYDPAGELASVALPGGRVITYKYDGAGNRIQVTDTDAAATVDYAINNLSEYTTVGNATFTYDVDGNLLTRTDDSGVTHYGYDVQGRLISIVGSDDTWSFEYDALGNRAGVVHNGIRTSYLVDPTGSGQVLGTYDSSNAPTAHYVQAGGLLSQVDAQGNANFYQFDGQGNTAALTDSAGNILNSYTFLPFGAELSSSGTAANPFTFSGQFGVQDLGDGFYATKNRPYDPAIGRFVQPDPTGFAGQDVNLYRYANNNPISLADPSGLSYVPFFNLGVNDLLNLTAAQAQNYLANEGALLARGAALGNAQASNALKLLQLIAGDGGAAAAADGATAGGLTTGSGLLSAGATDTAAGGLTTATTSGLTGSGAGTVAAAPFVAAVSGTAVIGAGTLGYLKTVTDSDYNAAAFTDNPVRMNYQYLQRLSNNIYNDPIKYNVALDLARENGHPGKPDANDLIRASRLVDNYRRYGVATQHTPGDPNDITGPAGSGAANFVAPNQDFAYRIDFENMPSADAPAQVVLVTEQLNANLDWTTFQLGDFGFGGQTFAIPVGRTSYSTRLDESVKLGVYVDVDVNFNTTTGKLNWRFTSIDPATGDLPADILTGFLPTDIIDPEGEGFISYTVRPKAGLTTGVVVTAKATVIFDAGLSDESSLDTPLFTNTIDAGVPAGTAAVAKFVAPKFTVTWGGSDDVGGSGIGHYEVFVSDNGGPFTPFLLDTTQTSAIFTGIAGHTYSFYVFAIDNAGNTQPVPTTAQATAQAILDTPNKQFIAAVYLDLLKRSVDLGGLAFWSGQLQQGAPRNTIAAQLTHSAEYYKTNVIIPSYHQFLNREADPSGIDYWTQRLQGGLTDEQMQAGFIASPEFYAKAGGTDKLWIDALYQALLDRKPDASGENYWVGQLQGHQSRSEVANDFTGSPEGLGDRVQQTYQRYLGRKAGQSEVDFWVGQYHQGKTNEDIVTGFLASDEYFKDHTS